MEQPTIRRTIDIEGTPEELWELISTPEGWQAWLVDDAPLPIAPGSAGTVVDGGVERHVRVNTVDSGRRVTFDWWQADPDRASAVQLDLVRLDEQHSRLVITERLSASASVSTVASAALRWELRLLMLCAAALPALVRA
jgi:uncharacterized protein YndB with AHSA1/START domain